MNFCLNRSLIIIIIIIKILIIIFLDSYSFFNSWPMEKVTFFVSHLFRYLCIIIMMVMVVVVVIRLDLHLNIFLHQLSSFFYRYFSLKSHIPIILIFTHRNLFLNNNRIVIILMVMVVMVISIILFLYNNYLFFYNRLCSTSSVMLWNWFI
jgi:hypothetical protein